jgi:hypothetical protein
MRPQYSITQFLRTLKPILVLVITLLLGCVSAQRNNVVYRPLGLDEEKHRKWKAITTNQAYADQPASVPVNPSIAKSGDGDVFAPRKIAHRTSLAIVEFNDQGLLKADQQLIQLMDSLSERPSGKPLLLVLFVHGWNHDASPMDANLNSFRAFLSGLDRDPAIRGEIVGVFTGWPGNVSPYAGKQPFSAVESVHQFLSFGDRFRGAQRIGRLSCTETLLSIIASAKTERLRNGQTKMRNRKQVTSIVAGHSMGGLIVERSFLQALLGYKIINVPTDDRLRDLDQTALAAVEGYQAIEKKLTETKTKSRSKRDDLQTEYGNLTNQWKGTADKLVQLEIESDKIGSNIRDTREQFNVPARQSLFLPFYDPIDKMLSTTGANPFAGLLVSIRSLLLPPKEAKSGSPGGRRSIQVFKSPLRHYIPPPPKIT